ncbi:hypothetical protein [Hydrogenophaga sp. BPS33]|uniref:hypothetical protein n=1 Tax=Hydrogenophaga sp. BPS33 TaxID=2651974 RepID=UPI001320091B|nr:hypothetical protein [Hydrogenophaga sp. BPS33]QHE87162.1 hypothetical protein F9K07_20785 [Hydrogenophaga sp. BPS33]
MRLPAIKTTADSIKEFFGTRGNLDAPGVTSPALVMLEFYNIEPTGQLLMVCETSPLAAGDWIRIDDLEFSVDEQLSQDEVAQCIFVVSGGALDEVAAVGETANYQVYYSEELKGKLGLVPKRMTLNNDIYHA